MPARMDLIWSRTCLTGVANLWPVRGLIGYQDASQSLTTVNMLMLLDLFITWYLFSVLPLLPWVSCLMHVSQGGFVTVKSYVASEVHTRAWIITLRSTKGQMSSERARGSWYTKGMERIWSSSSRGSERTNLSSILIKNVWKIKIFDFLVS